MNNKEGEKKRVERVIKEGTFAGDKNPMAGTHRTGAQNPNFGNRWKKVHEMETKICEQCGKPFTGVKAHKHFQQRRFCSNTCSRKSTKGSSANSLAQLERFKNNWTTIICAECHEPFKISKARLKRTNQKYCSNSCARVGMDAVRYLNNYYTRFDKDLGHLVRSNLEKDICNILKAANIDYVY
jgi:hypothetical protein